MTNDVSFMETRANNGQQRSRSLIEMFNLMGVELYYLIACKELSNKHDDLYDVLRLKVQSIKTV